jgi:hypothetical protein
VREVRGDIWKWAEANHAEVVIPTNLGWKADGSNVMGRGLALQCADRFPEVPAWYGAICQACGPFTPVVIHPEHGLIFFPVKPLDCDEPHLSWRQKASLSLIRQSAFQLSQLRLGPTAIPLVGCGNGGLSEQDVMPIVRDMLKGQNHFTIVHPPMMARRGVRLCRNGG